MILLIDIGNSRIKWAILQDNKFQFENAVFYKNQTLATVFNNCFATYVKPAAVLVANVAGQKMSEALNAWLISTWNLTAQFIQAQPSYLGFTLAYGEAAEFGWDRWVALVALWHEYKKPLCLMGCGSALTFDAVDATGKHLGSLIAPGLHLQRNSIITQLSGCKLPESTPFSIKQGLGLSTTEAIIQGIVRMSGSFLNSNLEKYRKILGPETIAVITGGDAEILIPLINPVPILRPYLVLEGLKLFYKL